MHVKSLSDIHYQEVNIKKCETRMMGIAIDFTSVGKIYPLYMKRKSKDLTFIYLFTATCIRFHGLA